MLGEPSDIQELRPHECWELLRSAAVGRLAINAPDGPDIFPVNFAVDGGSIVFRTAPGSKSDAARSGEAVAFEADSVDPNEARVWSVVVRGTAERIRRIEELIDTTRLALTSWQRGAKPAFVRIVPITITGRTFAPTPRRGEPDADSADRQRPHLVPPTIHNASPRKGAP